MPKQQNAKNGDEPTGLPLSFFACPNGDCADFNRFNAGNLSVVEWMGKGKGIRRLYCKTCGTRFSERQGSLMQDTKLPEAAVVRVVKCLAHGCSVEATADICEVDPRSVQRLLERAGKRAADFHRLQLENLDEPLEAVQMDELHAKLVPSQACPERSRGVEGTVKRKDKTELVKVPKKLCKRLSKKRARHGFIRLWP
jgi:transposase-like protein